VRKEVVRELYVQHQLLIDFSQLNYLAFYHAMKNFVVCYNHSQSAIDLQVNIMTRVKESPFRACSQIDSNIRTLQVWSSSSSSSSSNKQQQPIVL
jgi:hypothetical protein